MNFKSLLLFLWLDLSKFLYIANSVLSFSSLLHPTKYNDFVLNILQQLNISDMVENISE